MLQGITPCSRLMAHPSPIVQQPPAAVEQELIRMGRDIRTARLRRNWRLEDLAARLGGGSRWRLGDIDGPPNSDV